MKMRINVNVNMDEFNEFSKKKNLKVVFHKSFDIIINRKSKYLRFRGGLLKCKQPLSQKLICKQPLGSVSNREFI